MRQLLPESTLQTLDDLTVTGDDGKVQQAVRDVVDAYRSQVVDLQFLREHTKIILQRPDANPIVHNVAAGRDNLDAILLANPAITPPVPAPTLDPADVYLALCLVLDPNRYPSLTQEAVNAWSPEQRAAADTWAMIAIAHVEHPEIDVPNEPGNVTALRVPDNGPTS